MQLDLTPDQRSFQSTTRDFLAKTASIEQIHALTNEPHGFERGWWQQAAELGWTAMLVPEDLGGGTVSGAPLGDLILIAEELGRHCAPGPLLTTSAVLTGLARAGEARADEIAAILAGDRIASWAVYEPSRGWDPATPGTTATPRSGGGYIVSGAKDRVEAGDQADVFLVTATSPDGPVQVLVPSDSAGLEVTPTWSLDCARRVARLDLDEVQVEPESIVDVGKDASEAIEAQLLVAATLASAEMTGAAQRAFDFTVQWMSDRYTFGRPLSSYQALKHRMADNKVWLEACQATTAGAAHALDLEPDRAAELVSVAKSYVGDKAPVMMQDFVQLHGGIGITWEHDLHLFLRRVTFDRALYGTPEEHRRRIASQLEGKAA